MYTQLIKSELQELNEGDVVYQTSLNSTYKSQFELTVVSTKIKPNGNKAIRFSYSCPYTKVTRFTNLVIGKSFNIAGERREYSDSTTGRAGTSIYSKLKN